MRSIVLSVAALSFLGSVSAASAGCLAGSAAGGVAGDMACHQCLLGVAAGCAVGHHMAKKKKG